MGAVNVPAQFHACAGPEKSLERSVLAHPKLPVREMVGKKRALAAPMRAFAAMRSCSAWRMSGRRSRRSEGNPSGIDGRVSSSMVFPSGNWSGVSAEKNGDAVFLLGDLFLDNRDSCKGLFVLGLDLGELKLGDYPSFEAQGKELV